MSYRTYEHLTIEEVADHIEKLNVHCASCTEVKITKDMLKHYDHTAGWRVKNHYEPQWIYFECPKCGYQSAIWKLTRQSKIAREQLKSYRR